MSAWKDRANYLLASIIVFLLDQTTKKIVTQGMIQHETIPVLPDFLNITYIHNRGAVFGLGSSVTSPYLSWGLSILSVGSLAVILIYFLRLNARNHSTFFGLALVLGGAVGNLYDRLRYGYVIDFVDVHWFEHHWPFFNVADMSICVGVGLLLISMSSKTDESEGSIHRAPTAAEP